MLNSDHLRYLHAAGFDYCSAESPRLWNHLESQINESNRIESRFRPLSAEAMVALIMNGEDALLDRLVAEHRRHGHIDRVSCVLNLPYSVGVDGVVSRAAVDESQLLQMVLNPGTASEQVIEVLPTAADAMPLTNQVTIEGGVYADGHTTGYFSLFPGSHKEMNDTVYLATHAEIRRLANEMLDNADDITVVTKAECAAMVEQVMRNLK